jgi:hypothetical protein
MKKKSDDKDRVKQLRQTWKTGHLTFIENRAPPSGLRLDCQTTAESTYARTKRSEH